MTAEFAITDRHGRHWSFRPHRHAATGEHTGQWDYEAPDGTRTQGGVVVSVLAAEIARLHAEKVQP